MVELEMFCAHQASQGPQLDKIELDHLSVRALTEISQNFALGANPTGYYVFLVPVRGLVSSSSGGLVPCKENFILSKAEPEL